MLFILIILILWGVYILIMKKNLGKEFMLSKALVPLAFICIICTMCLGINYVISAIPNINDGIAIHNFLSYWIISEDNWSITLFENYYNNSIYISLLLTFTYSILILLKK